MSKNYLGRTDLPTGLRNNNPGNLVISPNAWRGKIPVSQNTDGKFEQFTEIHWGIRAMMIDIIGDIKEGKNTLRKLIEEYAPSHENDTQAYISFVSAQASILPDVPIQLSKPILTAIIKAKMTMELGWDFIGMVRDEDIAEAYSVLDRDLPGSFIALDSKKKHCSKSRSHLSGWGLCAA